MNLSDLIFRADQQQSEADEGPSDDFIDGVRAGLNRAVRMAKDAGHPGLVAALRMLRDSPDPLPALPVTVSAETDEQGETP